MRKIVICLSVFFLINSFNLPELKSDINNIIVAKVGNSLISSIDIQNEIITNLLLNKEEITQEKINNNKNYAIKNLINKSIKRSEINQYEIKNFSKKDLQNYINSTAKEFNTDTKGLIEIFKRNNIDYDVFVQNYKIELLWNTLIYTIYKNQININIIDVENEVKKIKNFDTTEYDLSEIEITKSDYDKGVINEIFELIKNEGFEVAAKKFSIGVTAQNGGQLGWVTKLSLSGKYLQQINKMTIKEISPPIINKNSVSIIKINNFKTNKNKIKDGELKKRVLTKKKEEKLNLFSRSHFSNLENTISISFL